MSSSLKYQELLQSTLVSSPSCPHKKTDGPTLIWTLDFICTLFLVGRIRISFPQYILLAV